MTDGPIPTEPLDPDRPIEPIWWKRAAITTGEWLVWQRRFDDVCAELYLAKAEIISKDAQIAQLKTMLKQLAEVEGE